MERRDGGTSWKKISSLVRPQRMDGEAGGERRHALQLYRESSQHAALNTQARARYL